MNIHVMTFRPFLISPLLRVRLPVLSMDVNRSINLKPINLLYSISMSAGCSFTSTFSSLGVEDAILPITWPWMTFRVRPCRRISLTLALHRGSTCCIWGNETELWIKYQQARAFLFCEMMQIMRYTHFKVNCRIFKIKIIHNPISLWKGLKLIKMVLLL